MNRYMKTRYILTTIWAMLFCLNLLLCLTTSNPDALSWIITGMFFGGTIIMMLDNGLMKVENELISLYEIYVKKSDKLIGKIVNKRKNIHRTEKEVKEQ